MIPRLLGRDASEVEAIWRELYMGNVADGRGGAQVLAQSAPSTWRCGTSSARPPACRCTGCGVTTAARCRSTAPGVWRGLGGEGMAEKAKRFVEQGFSAVKMQVGHIWTRRRGRRQHRHGARGRRPRRRHHGRREHGLDRRQGHHHGPAPGGARHLLAGRAGDARRLRRLLPHRRRAHHPRGRRREPLHPLRPAPVLREPQVPHPAAGRDPRRPHRAAQDRRHRRHLGPA